MRAAIVALQGQREPDSPFAAAESEYAVAIGDALASRNFGPWLICDPASLLSTMAVPIPRLCADPANFWGYLKLWQWQRRNPPRLILCIGEESLRLGRRLLKMGNASQRRLYGLFLLNAPSKEAQKLLLDCSACICGSSLIAQELEGGIGYGKKPLRIKRTLPGIDIDAYAPGKKWHAGERFVFGMDGSLMSHSGALRVVRAMAALWQHDELPGWEVRMFGGGPRFAEIMDEAEKLGVLPRLSILNSQPLPEVAKLCHVWLSPGTSGHEPPWVLWAGFASRIPLICAQSQLHRERIPCKDAVISIESDNPQEMARAMLNIIRDAALREKTVAAAQPCLPELSLAGMGDRVGTALEELIQPGHLRASEAP